MDQTVARFFFQRRRRRGGGGGGSMRAGVHMHTYVHSSCVDISAMHFARLSAVGLWLWLWWVRWWCGMWFVNRSRSAAVGDDFSPRLNGNRAQVYSRKVMLATVVGQYECAGLYRPLRQQAEFCEMNGPSPFALA